MKIEKPLVTRGWHVVAKNAAGRERTVSRLYSSYETANTLREFLAKHGDEELVEPRVVEVKGYEPDVMKGS